MYVCMYVCMYACMHACMYIYIGRRLAPLDDTQSRLLVEMAFNLSKEVQILTYNII